jgi:radical SAM superfamily enzyme YgiQ (UPF0313 family)
MVNKLLLINPLGRRSGFLLSRISTFPPLGLAYVAGVTPPGWEIKILDENFDSFIFEEADLVGITGFTSNIRRAYEIAAIYRERGIKVVLGGIHASMNPEEAIQYADAVVAGEVEGIWAKVIEDFENERLEGVYKGPQVDLSNFKVRPRRDLLHPNYFWQPIQTSRGCPFACRFCSVSKYLGRDYRQRPAQDVLEELEEISTPYVLFSDDNLIGHSPESRARAKEIFNGMLERRMHKKWGMQTSINAADDEEVLHLAGKSGCMIVLMGFETVDVDTLKKMKKNVNVDAGIDNYKRVAQRFHQHGIGVLGTFIIGNDHESAAYYKKMAKFLLNSEIDIFQVTILTPLPGTALMEQIQQENRLISRNFPEDWDKYRFSYVVHRPEGIDVETIYMGNNYIKKSLYSFPAYPYRLLKSFIRLRSWPKAMMVYKLNQAYRKNWLNSHYRKKYPSVADKSISSLKIPEV